MFRAWLSLLLVLWYDLTTLSVIGWLRKYRLVMVPMDGIDEYGEDGTLARTFFSTGPAIPMGTVYRMRVERARHFYWQWYAIDKTGALNQIDEPVARYLLRHYRIVMWQRRVVVGALMVLPPLAAYALVSHFTGR